MLLSLQLALQALAFSDVGDDELAVLYITTRNERHFAELYRRYSSRVYARCVSMLQDDAEAQDAVQDIFERVLLRIGNFEGKAKFGTWLFSISTNHCIDRLRRRQRQSGKTTAFREDDVIQAPPPADDWLEQQSPEAIEYILGELSELDRAVLVLKYMDELSVQDIGTSLGLKGSATMRLKRARERAYRFYRQWATHRELTTP